ncbi:MAG: YncE family protein [Alkaliphilus sp.]
MYIDNVVSRIIKEGDMMGCSFFGKLIISNFSGDTISIVNVEGGLEIKRIKLNSEGKSCLSQKLGPHHIAYDKTSGYLYVPCSYNNRIIVLNLNSGEVIDSISVGSNPCQVIICNKYNSVYIANADSNSISIISLDTMEVTHHIPTGQMPHGMALSKDEESVYIANTESQTITEIATRTNEKTKCHRVCCNPWHLRMSADGKYMYVVHYSFLYEREGRVLIYGVDEMVLLREINIGTMPVEVSGDNKNEMLYITDSDNDVLYIFNLIKHIVQHAIPVSKMPHGLEIDNENKLAFITSLKENVIDIIDIKKLKLIKSIPVGMEPTSILIN